MFLTLMRKDLRVLRPVLVAAILIAVVCDVVVPAVAIFQQRQAVMPAEFTTARVWRAVQAGVVVALVFTSGLLTATFAGVGAPAERRERWADLAAMLPVSRARRTLARLAVAASLAGVAWMLHAALLTLGNRFVPPGWRVFNGGELWFYASIALAMFGIAWLGAAFYRSPSYAVCTSIGCVLGSFLLVVTIHDTFFVGVPDSNSLIHRYLRVIALLGVVAIVLGTILESRRIEP